MSEVLPDVIHALSDPHGVDPLLTLHRDLVDRLTTPNMEWAWREVLKLEDMRGAERKWRNPPVAVFSQIFCAITASDPESKRDIAKRYREVAKAARTFAKTIQATPFDASPFRWFSEGSAQDLLGKMRFDVRTRGVPDYLSLPKDFGMQLCLIDEQSAPTMAALALAIAEDAERTARAVAESPARFCKPSAGNQRRRLFILKLGTAFQRRYGKVMKRTVARFATAALQEEVTEEHVKDAFRLSASWASQASTGFDMLEDRPRAPSWRLSRLGD